MNTLFSDLCVPFLEFQVGCVVFDGTNYYIFIFDTIQSKTVLTFYKILKPFQVIMMTATVDYKSAISGFWLQNTNKAAFQKIL